jgi:hypothetical protein
MDELRSVLTQLQDPKVYALVMDDRLLKDRTKEHSELIVVYVFDRLKAFFGNTTKYWWSNIDDRNIVIATWMSGLRDLSGARIMKCLLEICCARTEFKKYPPMNVVEFHKVVLQDASRVKGIEATQKMMAEKMLPMPSQLASKIPSNNADGSVKINLTSKPAEVQYRTDEELAFAAIQFARMRSMLK